MTAERIKELYCFFMQVEAATTFHFKNEQELRAFFDYVLINSSTERIQ